MAGSGRRSPDTGSRQCRCGRYAATEIANTSVAAIADSRCSNYAGDIGHFRRLGYEVIYSALRQQDK